MNKLVGYLVAALSFISGGICFYVGKQIHDAAYLMTLLRSRGGETVAEAYFQLVGHLGLGFSLFSYALGVAIIMFGVALGSIINSHSSSSDRVK